MRWVITVWLVYGREMTYRGEVMGALPAGFYQRENAALAMPAHLRPAPVTTLSTQGL